MIKLKSSLTCTIVSLLMVFFFTSAVLGGHPWTEEDPPGNKEWGGTPPGPGPDSESSRENVINSARYYSTFGLYSSIVVDVSAMLVDYVYGTDAEGTKVGIAVGNDSSRK